MTDEKIIEMLFERNEDALREVEKKYAVFCHTVAANILAIREDREECVNDVLLALWNAIPPEPEYDGSQGLEYQIIGNYAEVIGIGTCSDTEIVIPSQYKGYPVREID
jgi:hypothetical protein